MVTSPAPSQQRPAAPMAAYTNYFEVGHNAFEFLVDFGQFQPEAETVAMHSRIVTGPVHAKLLAQLLSQAVTRFEDEHGAIVDLAGPEIDALLIPPPDFEHRAEMARAESRFPFATER
jgi:Protein of unknown function (DUF3467)